MMASVVDRLEMLHNFAVLELGGLRRGAKEQQTAGAGAGGGGGVGDGGAAVRRGV